MLLEIVLLFVLAIFSYIFYKFLMIDKLYYAKLNLKYKPLSYTLSNQFGMIFGKYTGEEAANRIYYAFPDEPIFGMVGFGAPQYCVRNPELIKKITIKDFDYFEDRNAMNDEKFDKQDYWFNSLLMLKGQKWRQMRATLSPAFTGSKMRQMYDLISECAQDIVKHFNQRIKAKEKINLEMKDFFSRYTNDAIYACAFGLKVNSFTEPDNDFYLEAKKIANFGRSINIIKMIFLFRFPTLGKLLSLRVIESTMLRRIVLDTMESRKKYNISQPDMINILMQVRDGSLRHQTDANSVVMKEGFATVEESDIGKEIVNRVWSDDDLVAQCFIFLLAGYDTSSSILTFTTYELIANPHIQQKLYEEIAEMNKQLNGAQINYDYLQKMKYLDQVFSEVLRKWTALIHAHRLCTKDYVLDDGDKIKFKIEKDSLIHIPVYAIHHDPKYYPEPEKFDPERFNDENKSKIQPGTYLPFGIGPRNCIGSRFALMEIKAILYHLLLNFSFEANELTDIPYKLKKSGFGLTMKNGMHLELKPRIK